MHSGAKIFKMMAKKYYIFRQIALFLKFSSPLFQVSHPWLLPFQGSCNRGFYTRHINTNAVPDSKSICIQNLISRFQNFFLFWITHPTKWVHYSKDIYLVLNGSFLHKRIIIWSPLNLDFHAWCDNQV